MSRYFGSTASFRSKRFGDDVDPMNSMSGIGDVMLVFACGLMTALIVAWSVDLGQFSQVEVGDQLEDVQAADQNSAGGEGYIEMGTVYMDPETGEYYLLEDSSASVN